MSNQETGWLIEHPHDPRYGRESWYAGKDGFTIDSLQAVRFARQEDAEREIDRLPLSIAKSLRAVEHAWIPPMPPPDLRRGEKWGGLTAFGRTCHHGQIAAHCQTCAALIESDKWRVLYENLHDWSRLIGVILSEHGYVIGDRDQIVSSLNTAMADLEGYKKGEIDRRLRAGEEP